MILKSWFNANEMINHLDRDGNYRSIGHCASNEMMIEEGVTMVVVEVIAIMILIIVVQVIKLLCQ